MRQRRCSRRRRLRGAAGLVAAVIATGIVAPAPSGAAGTRSTAITRFGVYAFSDLGYRSRTLAGAELDRGVDVRFRLPPRAREGPGHWYLLRLHLIAELAPGAHGTAYIGAVSSSYGTAQIAFKAEGGRRTWRAVGLLKGTEVHAIAGQRVELRFANFMPFPSVHGGENTLRVSVEQFGSVIRSLRVLDDSALEYTRRGPADLRMSAVLNHAVGHTRQALVATVTVRNLGGRSARSIVLSGIAGTPGFRFEGPRRRLHEQLDPDETWTESFVLRLLRPGPQRVLFLATSTANRPGAELDFRAVGTAAARSSAPSGPKTSDGNGLWIALVVAGVLAAGLLAAALRRRAGRR